MVPWVRRTTRTPTHAPTHARTHAHTCAHTHAHTCHNPQERDVKARYIRLKESDRHRDDHSPRPLLREGDKVEARYRGKARYVVGVCRRPPPTSH